MSNIENKLKIELIIFDMDGLMFDSEKISYMAWREAAAIYGYEINDEIFQKTIGSNLIKTKEIYLSHFGSSFPIERIVDERVRVSEEIVKSKGIDVKKGLYDLLSYIKQINIKKAVATSTNRKRAMGLLKVANIDNYFDYILCGDEIKKSKPDPEIFLKTANKLGCLPKNCIVLEDSEAGIAAGYAAGMIPIMIPDMKEPDDKTQKLLFKKMNDLLEVKYFLENYCSESSSA